MNKLLIAIGFLFIGCSTAEMTVEDAEAQTQATQQTQTDETAEPPRNLSERAAYSLYYSNYGSEQYEEALEFGRWILISMTETIEGYEAFSLPKNLGRFEDIYSSLAETTNDPELKAGYIDTVKNIYNKIFENFSQDEINYFNWYIGKGRFYQQFEDFIEEDAETVATEAYKNAFNLNPEEMAETGEGYYIRVLLQNLASKDTEESKQEALAIIDESEQYAGEDLEEYFDEVRRSLFDEPEERIAFLESELEETPDNVEILTQLRNIYQRQGNSQEVQELNRRLYELNPNYQTITALANFAVDQANYNEAIGYLEEAIDETDDPERLKIIYLNLSSAYLNLDNLPEAQDNAKKAINIDSDWGRPYIQLSTIYARAISNCSSGRDLTTEDRAVYWLVLDYLNEAKSVDSSVASSADSRIETYLSYTPSTQDIFFNDAWTEGESIGIDGSLGSCYSWINETTTVR